MMDGHRSESPPNRQTSEMIKEMKRHLFIKFMGHYSTGNGALLLPVLQQYSCFSFYVAFVVLHICYLPVFQLHLEVSSIHSYY